MPAFNSRVLRIVAYAALAVVSIASGILVAAKYIQAKKSNHPARIIVGSRFPQDLDWQNAERTLVLVMQEGCKYCADSTEFYQRLVSKSAEEHMRVIALMPQEVSEGKQYLNKEHINIFEVRKAQLGLLGIIRTPSLFFVDNSGTITKVWIGKLSIDKEQEVLACVDYNCR